MHTLCNNSTLCVYVSVELSRGRDGTRADRVRRRGFKQNCAISPSDSSPSMRVTDYYVNQLFGMKVILINAS